MKILFRSNYFYENIIFNYIYTVIIPSLHLFRIPTVPCRDILRVPRAFSCPPSVSVSPERVRVPRACPCPLNMSLYFLILLSSYLAYLSGLKSLFTFMPLIMIFLLRF